MLKKVEENSMSFKRFLLLHLSVLSLLILTSFVANARGLPEFTDLVEEKSPAVVKITTVTKSSAPSYPDFDLPENIPEIFRHFLDLTGFRHRGIGA